MAEEFVELGFEGLDRFADRYFDRTYNHLPNIPRPGRRRRQPQPRQLPSGNLPQHPDKGYDSTQAPPEDVYSHEANPEMYGAGGQDGYARDQRYYEADRADYMNRAPGPGFRVPRDRPEEYGGWSTQPYMQAGQRDRGRPEPQRRRSSWSPPRSERRGRSESRRARSRSKSGSQSRADDAKRRFIATIGGALVGGLAGKQVGKGRQYDTAATVAGAILGGVGAREAADHWDKARQKKKEGRGERWQSDYGNGEGRRNEKWHDGRLQRYDNDDGRR